MNHAITHVLVPVDPDDDSLTAQLAALHLASGAGALVTLLYVHDRHARMHVTSQLDALSNLHQVMMAPPEDNQVAPVHADPGRGKSIRSLRKMRSKLALMGPDDLQIRVACRRGDPAEETEAFINEAGVDVVMVQSPSTCKSSSLRQLVRSLQQKCACQLQIVHPPRTKSASGFLNWSILSWWTSLATRWRKLDQRIMPPSGPITSVDP